MQPGDKLSPYEMQQIQKLADERYGGDLTKAACHRIYGRGVVKMGGEAIPTGMDMTLIDQAVAQIEGAKSSASSGKKPAVKNKPAAKAPAPKAKPKARAKAKKPAAKKR